MISCGGCGAGMAPGIGACGACGWNRRHQRSLSDEVGTYMADKAIADNFEATGRGDSPLADAARAGMKASQIQIIVGIVAAIIMLIIFLAIVSHMNSHGANGLSPMSLHRLVLDLSRSPALALR